MAIHQPNFFPWLGYFEKIARADVFVFLDHVRLQKTGGSWTNRVKLLIGGVPQWVTAPILRAAHGADAICDSKFDERSPWREKLLKTLAANYRRAPHYREVIELLEPLILQRTPGPGTYNAHAIEGIRTALGLNSAQLIRSSQLSSSETANDLLIALCRQVGGTAYLCGNGAASYQDETAFSRAGIELVYQNFQHPSYPQVGAGSAFVPGLSVLDALMNCGCSGTVDLLFHSR